MTAAIDLSIISSFLFPVLLLLLLYFLSQRLWKTGSNANLPPIEKGWIPFIGCALDFGKEPLWYIQQAKARLGPVFTLYVAGKRLTFVTEAEDFKHFFNSPNVDFQHAVQGPVKRTASVTVQSFFQYHTKIHDTVKGRLAPSNLPLFSGPLQEAFSEQLKTWGKRGSNADLMSIIRLAMYAAVSDNLFGKNVLPTKTDKELEEFANHFIEFDDKFEYGSQLPEIFLKSWATSKHWLLNLFRGVVKQVEGNDKEKSESLFQTLISAVDRPHAPNYGLLMLWASLANAIPITFWTAAFILTNENIAKRVKQDIERVLGKYENGIHQITEEVLSQLPYIKFCILEAIRMRSPGTIARGVVKPLKIRDYIVPPGDLLLLSPYWAHRDPKNFPEPGKYNPDRWLKCDLSKNVFLDGFVAFGGGRYQCPGRWFALLEIHMFVVMMFHMFEFEALNSLPELSPLHLVGTQQPISDFKVNYQRH